MKKTFTKQDLIDGMTIVHRDRTISLYSNKVFYVFENNMFLVNQRIDDFDDNLNSVYENDSNMDIVKILIGTTIVWKREQMTTLEEVITSKNSFRHCYNKNSHTCIIDALKEIHDMCMSKCDNDIEFANRTVLNAINSKGWIVEY